MPLWDTSSNAEGPHVRESVITPIGYPDDIWEHLVLSGCTLDEVLDQVYVWTAFTVRLQYLLQEVVPQSLVLWFFLPVSFTDFLDLVFSSAHQIPVLP